MWVVSSCSQIFSKNYQMYLINCLRFGYRQLFLFPSKEFAEFFGEVGEVAADYVEGGDEDEG